MTFPELFQLANTLGLLIIGVLGFINRKAIREVHLMINSRLSELILASNAQARSEGVTEGRAMDKIDPAVTAQAAAKVLETAREVAKPTP